MPEVIVLYKTKTEPVKEKSQRELVWYDSLKKELLTFCGGKLSFEYREDEYLKKMGAAERQKRGIHSVFRMLPKVEDLEVFNYNKTKTNSNEKEVKKWFNNYINYNITNILIVSYDKNGIMVDVPKKEMDDFLYQCERDGLKALSI